MLVRRSGGEGVDHISNIAEKILPILTPEQRKIAADKLRDMANNGDSSRKRSASHSRTAMSQPATSSGTAPSRG